MKTGLPPHTPITCHFVPNNGDASVEEYRGSAAALHRVNTMDPEIVNAIEGVLETGGPVDIRAINGVIRLAVATPDSQGAVHG
jgi:hypothetical protein